MTKELVEKIIDTLEDVSYKIHWVNHENTCFHVFRYTGNELDPQTIIEEVETGKQLCTAVCGESFYLEFIDVNTDFVEEDMKEDYVCVECMNFICDEMNLDWHGNGDGTIMIE